LGASYLQEKNDVNAAYHFRETIEYLPNDYQAFYFLARLLERQKNAAFNQIQQYFQETLPTDQKGKFPEQFTSYVQLLRPASAFLTKEEKQYTELAREQQLKLWSSYVETYQQNARRYLKDETPDKATFEIRKGISLAPFDWYLHYLLGLAFEQQKSRSSSVLEFQFSIWCLDNVESHLELADIYRESEQYKDAKLQIQQTLVLDPKNKKALDLWNKIWNK
jgi:tetratricopeptide (TPR) repeat protein